jgi:predicted nucleic acid-binding protein
MPKTAGLLDSNVLIAGLVEAHEHHLPSLSLLTNASSIRFAIAADSYAEPYSTPTRGQRTPFQVRPETAWAVLESVRAVTALAGLTPA